MGRPDAVPYQHLWEKLFHWRDDSDQSNIRTVDQDEGLQAVFGHRRYVVVSRLSKVESVKLKVHIAERVEYLTQFKRVARTDSVNRIPLLSLTPAAKENYLLPLSMDDPDALKNSPLNQLFQDDDDLSEIASSYMGPGPWHIETEVQLPKSCTQLHFTNKNKKSNILVTHLLKVIFRVQRGDDRDLDPVTGRRKMYDIVVQTPIHILSVSYPFS